MTKMVIYNGKTSSYGGCCSAPTQLEKGNSYEVISEDITDFQTYYTLKEVPGSFNSIWFDDMLNTYLALSYQIPVEGNCLENFARINCCTKTWEKIKKSDIISKVNLIGLNTYEVHTKSAIYIVQVIEKNNPKTSV